MNFKIPHNLVTGIGEHHENLKICGFGERFVPLLSQIHSSHFQFLVLNNSVILFTTEYPLQGTVFLTCESTFSHISLKQHNASLSHTFPDSGNAAIVKFGPPEFSSKWLMSTNGTSPFARLAVQATTYSVMGMPASIRAKVAALTHVQ